VKRSATEPVLAGSRRSHWIARGKVCATDEKLGARTSCESVATNLLDKHPPLAPDGAYATNASFCDRIGRSFRPGKPGAISEALSLLMGGATRCRQVRLPVPAFIQ
jgi:hypothetical protein